MSIEKKIKFQLYDLDGLHLGKKNYKNIEFIDLKSENQIIEIDEVFIRNYVGQKINSILNQDIFFIDLEFGRNDNLLLFFQQFEIKIIELLKNDDFKLIKSCQQFQNYHDFENIQQQFISCIFKNSFDYFIRCKIKHDNLNFDLPVLDQEDQLLSLEQLEINQYYHIEIQCNGIWIYNSNFGLSWNINQIKKI